MPAFLQHRAVRVLFWLIVILVGFSAYFRGIERMWPQNPLLTGKGNKGYDQSYYMEAAKGFAAGNGTLDRARSRMPLYSWIISRLYDAKLEPQALIQRYMTFNVILSVGVLLGVGLIIQRHLGPWWAVWITLVMALNVLLTKAILIQPEVLYYFTSFAVFIGMLQALSRTDWYWRQMIGLGLLTGVNHLLKGSALPMIAFFIMLLIGRSGWIWFQSRPTTSWKLIALPGVFLAAFLSVTGYYMFHSVCWYGSPFYDPNSRYYLWAESPEEMFSMQQTGLAYTVPNLKPPLLDDPDMKNFLPRWVPDEKRRAELEAQVRATGRVDLVGEWDILPGARKYFQTHSLGQTFTRLSDGVIEVARHNAAHLDGYGKYLIALSLGAFVFGGMAVVRSTTEERRAWLRSYGWAAAFVLLTISVNYLLYAWWASVSNRNRFFLTIYLPMMFSAAVIIQRSLVHLPLGWAVPLPGGKSFRITLGGLLLLALFVWFLRDNRQLHTGHLVQ